MRVAILVKEFPPDVIGGTETQTLKMARELELRTAHEITVYTKEYHSHTPDVPFELVRVPNYRRSRFLSTATFVLAAFLLLLRDRNRIDVLQCMMIYPTGFVGYVLHRFTGIPYFAWIRGGDYYFMKDTPVKRWTIRQVLYDTLVLVQAERIRSDVLEEFPAADIQVVGNGVDLPAETASGDKIVFVGRLKEQKGVDVLIRALAPLDEQLLLAGDGHERDKLESMAENLGVSAEFVGEVPPDQVIDHLLQGKLFVLPSRRGEGLPNAILEAMAVGLPVVATDTAGVANAIENGRTGFVVQPGEVEQLRARIKYLCEHSDERATMGRHAKEYVEEHHAWPVILDRVTNVYEQVGKR